MKKIKHIILFLLLLSTTSCNTIFEFPEGEGTDPTLVNLSLNTTISASSLAEFTDYSGVASLARSDIDSYYLRTKIQIFASGSLSTSVADTVIYTSLSEIDNFELNTTFTLNSKEYTVAVWSDVVDNKNNEDLFFLSSNLAAILHSEPYTGAQDLKLCYAGSIDVDLTPYKDAWNITHKEQIEIERPLAKYEIISNDLAEFISEQSKSKSASSDVFEQYTIKLNYESYVLYGYNTFTDVPNNSQSGISFTANLEILSDSEALLSFDHVLVNHSQTTVYVGMDVYNENGELVTQVSSISIPLLRNQKTTITGDFLTRDYAPGVTIDPEFDGNFNIYID
ncbi:MAG: DUF6562 domain-containing protein [Rikenellaceae bacterium]